MPGISKMPGIFITQKIPKFDRLKSGFKKFPV
jgi:hypothetical protein